jgi:hypothetical protein
MPLGFGAVGRDAVAGSLDRRSAGGNESRFDGWVLNLQRFRIYLDSGRQLFSKIKPNTL